MYVTANPGGGVQQKRDGAGRVWLHGAAAAALAVTTLEAALLQQRKSFFTGGFLTDVHATGWIDGLAFLLTSLVVDFGVAAIPALLMIWLASRLRLNRVARLALVVIGSLAPFVAWDIATYSLLAYLGDAFDLGLMFDLTGGSPREILAVASSHLRAPALMALAAVATLAGVIWALNRRGNAAARMRSRPPLTLSAWALGCFLIAIGTSVVAERASGLAEDGLRRKASGNLLMRLTAAATDFDGDGFGLVGRTNDPAPWNGEIHPYALDLPGNGLDENAIAGDLPATEPAYQETDATALWRQRPHIILFVLESFRADAVGRVVNGTAVTPHLDALGREGISAAAAFSHNGYTTQSRFHLLAGRVAGGRSGRSLIDDFNANGYQTAYFSAQDESFGGPSLGVGFDRAEVAYDARQDRGRRYSTFATAGSLAVSHAVLRERINEFLRRRDPARPLFLYVNFHDTHYPYNHRELAPLVSSEPLRESDIAPGRAEALRQMYYNAAANVDRALGVTLQDVTATLGAPPAVIVTADHGESLFDENFLGHGYALNDAQTRIPLIVRGLPVDIVEPFGQADLRGAINAALSGEDDGRDTPRLVQRPDKEVFQYLGNIQRPRQIGVIGATGRLAYDFRDRLVRLADGRRVDPAALTGGEAQRFTRLVRLWERMMLARSAWSVP